MKKSRNSDMPKIEESAASELSPAQREENFRQFLRYARGLRPAGRKKADCAKLKRP